jgi:heterotetrameric sarcosine oxidase gamma subunit
MADPAADSAIADLVRPHRLGPEGKAGIRLIERAGIAIWQVAAWRATGVPAVRSALRKSLRVTLPEQPNGTANAGGATAIWIAPQRLWLVATAQHAVSLAGLPDLLAGRAAVTDLSHARVVLRLSGPQARSALAKLCRIDLHPKAFAPGRTAQTLLGQVPALIHCVDEAPTFDLYLPRSLAQSAMEMLIDAAAEFGLEVGMPPTR